MKNFGDLSGKGRLGRLRLLALEALTLYDLDRAALDYHCTVTNVFYRVTAADGSRYALRIAAPGWRRRSDLIAEAMWLDALGRETDIPVPRIVATRDGETVPSVRHRGIPEPRNVTLMTWLPGRVLTGNLTPSNLRKMGELFARLHVHGGTWVPPDGFPAGTFDGYLSRGEPEVIFDNPQLEAYRPADLELLRMLRDRVEAVYNRLDRSDLRVIHCDLWHANVKIHRGILSPFDFEDTIVGFRLHDIAMAMLDLLEEVGSEAYPGLLDAFRRGYESLLTWPEGEMETLQVGRILWKMNYVARFQRRWLSDMTVRLAPVLERFERYGTLRFDRPS